MTWHQKIAESRLGCSYKWDSEQTDALMVDEDGAESVLDGGHIWRFPSRSECAAEPDALSGSDGHDAFTECFYSKNGALNSFGEAF